MFPQRLGQPAQGSLWLGAPADLHLGRPAGTVGYRLPLAGHLRIAPHELSHSKSGGE